MDNLESETVFFVFKRFSMSWRGIDFVLDVFSKSYQGKIFREINARRLLHVCKNIILINRFSKQINNHSMLIKVFTESKLKFYCYNLSFNPIIRSFGCNSFEINLNEF